MQNAEIDIKKLLSTLDFSVEDLAEASAIQSKLFEQVAQYRASCLRRKLETEAAYDLAKAKRSLSLRHKAEAEGRKVTEGLIADSVTVGKSVRAALADFIEAQSLDEYSKNLVDAFRMRRDSIRVLEDISERRSVGADSTEATKKLRDVREKLAKRYSQMEEEG